MSYDPKDVEVDLPKLMKSQLSKQTQDYIILKPIAERFKEIAATITDKEIKDIIKSELRDQIRNQVDFGSTIAEWVNNMLEEDDYWVELVTNCMKESIKNKFK